MRRSPSLRVTHEHWSTGDAFVAGIGFLIGLLLLVGIVALIAISGAATPSLSIFHCCRKTTV